MKLPILLLIFNRSDHAFQAMKAIREYAPDKIYIGADGPRTSKIGEKEVCEEVRKEILAAIDWDCEVFTLFRDTNLGCAEAVNGAITWFFENEEYGIICEDDILLSSDFFKLCEDLLLRYKDEDRIMEISARNESFRTDIGNTYVYTQCYHCWGWATWRRAWKKMDMSMSSIDQMSRMYLIKRLGLIRGYMMHRYFVSGKRKLEHFNSWATRWYLSIMACDGLVICPGVNLALNIGLGGGSHYNSGVQDPFEKLNLCNIKWPLVYNDSLIIDKQQKRYDNKAFLLRRFMGLKYKLHLK